MNELVQHQGGGALTVRDMAEQVNQIQALMKQVMKEDTHYGAIPGTGGKKALLKAGAEKIGLMFGCRTSYQIDREDLPNGHREYQVICQITDRQGNEIGQGVGVCSTMEKKYRYRAENTGALVPKEYWESKDQSLLGGPEFVPRKNNGKWFIFQQVEYDNPADYHNTCLKIGKKRAYVDAILTCTAASDFFDQEEVVDVPELYPDHTTEPADEPRRQPKAQAKDTGASGTITQGQARIVRKAMADKSLEDQHICKEFGVKSIEEIPSAKINAVLEWIDSASG